MFSCVSGCFLSMNSCNIVALNCLHVRLPVATFFTICIAATGPIITVSQTTKYLNACAVQGEREREVWAKKGNMRPTEKFASLNCDTLLLQPFIIGCVCVCVCLFVHVCVCVYGALLFQHGKCLPSHCNIVHSKDASKAVC